MQQRQKYFKNGNTYLKRKYLCIAKRGEKPFPEGGGYGFQTAMKYRPLPVRIVFGLVVGMRYNSVFTGLSEVLLPVFFYRAK
jgi:hypothetical protein